MPTPIIDLQRRLTLVGAIRAGGEKQPKAPGRKLESFRLTSPRKALVEQAAGLYGGKPTAWKSGSGDEWQLYTESAELSVLVMPGYSLRQTYEQWEGATQRLRLCDGVDEELSGGPCVCNAEGIDRCDIYTRLVVALPELDTLLGWRLITKGANAAHELPTMLQFIEAHANGAPFVPARLVLDQRRGVKDGQVVRYVVPTLDLSVSYATLAAGAGRPQLMAAQPGPQVPAPEDLSAPERPVQLAAARPAVQTSVDVAAALDAVTGDPAGPALGSRHAAPLPTPRFEPVPMPEAPADDAVPVVPEGAYSETRQTKHLTEPQATKLNVLVGKLRDGGGHISTEELWLSVATRLRDMDAAEMIEELGGRDAEGVLHWAPLRESLLRSEASQLIEWLEEKQRRVETAA